MTNTKFKPNKDLETYLECAVVFTLESRELAAIIKT